jgi:membrane-associated phospholipid phosphatase
LPADEGNAMTKTSCSVTLAVIVTIGLAGIGWTAQADEGQSTTIAPRRSEILDWNQIFIDTLIATTTPNSSSQRLGAIVHTAIFDAYNGIEQRYTPIFVHDKAPRWASRRAAVMAAARTALVGLFPSQQAALDARYEPSLAALRDECELSSHSHGPISCETRIDRGVAWGTQVAVAVLDWRGNDGFGGTYPSFGGGTAIGQWRPTPPAFGTMSAQGLAFTDMFVLSSNDQFRPGPPRGLTSDTYTEDFNAVKELGRKTDSTRTDDDQAALAVFWEGNASVHWNQAANQIARANHLSMSDTNRLLAVLNIAMADTAFTIWSAKRFYGAAVPAEVTWRPVTSIPLAETDGNPNTTPDPAWTPLVNTPSHPEYPAGHPSLNGAAATILLRYFGPLQTFTLTTGQTSRTYESITQARADGNDARVWGGMHYPSTVEISDAVGEQIARYVNRHSMQRRRGAR